MRRATVAIAAAAAALALALPAAAHAPQRPAGVSILFPAFEPPAGRLPAGDPVKWTHPSSAEQTGTGPERRFGSGNIAPERNYAQRFGASGNYPYFCRIHPTMQGTVDVRSLLLEGPAAAVLGGTQVELPGRAIPGVGAVTIQADSGSGFRTISIAGVTAGKFHVHVRPQVSTTYRAMAGPHVSQAVRVVVGRPLGLAARRRGRKSVRLTVTALAARPGSTVVLQTWLKERFGWWPIARRSLDRSSQARFDFRRRRRGRRMRVVLTEPDGVTALSVSNVVKSRGTSRRRR